MCWSWVMNTQGSSQEVVCNLLANCPEERKINLFRPIGQLMIHQCNWDTNTEWNKTQYSTEEVGLTMDQCWFTNLLDNVCSCTNVQQPYWTLHLYVLWLCQDFNKHPCLIIVSEKCGYICNGELNALLAIGSCVRLNALLAIGSCVRLNALLAIGSCVRLNGLLVIRNYMGSFGNGYLCQTTMSCPRLKGIIGIFAMRNCVRLHATYW